MPKILSIVNSCNKCPHKQYRSGGIHECAQVSVDLDPEVLIPSWCPLPDHPAALIAKQEERIRALTDALFEAQNKK